MSDAESAPAPAAATPAKKTPKKKAAAKPKKVASHPKYSEMVKTAIAALKERGGSSRQAILKYIVANYKVSADAAKNPLKLSLKAGVKNGSLKQSKGTGASGSFRLGDKAEKPKAKKAAKPKAAGAKKPAAKKVKKPKAAGAKKSPKKVKKPAKKPAGEKKAKATKPKAKKPAAKKAKSPKKAAKAKK